MSQSIVNQTLLAFLGGALAFVSLCTAISLLGYLSFLLGAGALAPAERRARAILLNALFFAAGFSILFSLGLLPSPVQLFLVDAYHSIAKVAGGVAIAFGLLFISRSGGPLVGEKTSSDAIMDTRPWFAAAFVLGALFGAVWPYCVGPILGTIVSLTSAPWSAARGQYLLIVYVVGLATAFAVSGVALSRLLSALFARVKPEVSRGLLLAAGVVQTALGVSLVFAGLWLSLSRVFIRLAGNSPQARLEELLLRLLG